MQTSRLFAKYQGLGNDFILLEVQRPSLSKSEVQRLCNRHVGIGADGVIELFPADKSQIAMRVHNADGSLAQMCGNGFRCVAAYLRDEKRIDESKAMAIQTDAGLKNFRYQGDVISVEMGLVSVEPIAIDIDGKNFSAFKVDVGNPHLVIAYSASQEKAKRWGQALQKHPAFSEGVNVEFVTQKSKKELDVLVWERGAGLTRACGTGACAAASAFLHAGRIEDASKIQVNLAGGFLEIVLSKEGKDFRVEMLGPAEKVFTGEVRACFQEASCAI